MISIGTVVKLKSGGPKMTVEYIYPNTSVLSGYAKCIYWDESKNEYETIDAHKSALAEVKE